ncbi:hypothetical protein [Burkholderia pseudomallei]|nr:hypothetical protein [Burkholderia pseudomallei]MBM5627409.1 hypothetical protein [Burkholderia pseudomallei]
MSAGRPLARPAPRIARFLRRQKNEAGGGGGGGGAPPPPPPRAEGRRWR